MSISADQRYYLKRKALYYFYEKNYSNTDIAKMLGISRVTLNRLLAEAKDEGMVKIEIIDTRNINHILELEDRIKSRYNMEYVKIVDTDTAVPDALISKLALEGARYLERMLRSGIKIGLGWGRTLSTLINDLTPHAGITGIEVYTLMGGACSEANFQPNLLAHPFRRRISRRNDSQPISIRHGRRQLSVGNPCHTALNYRIGNPKQIT